MRPSDQIGGYELRAKLAVGGYCEIWLATQRGPSGFKRMCTLKLLKEEHLRDDASRRSLMAEARLVARMRHPRIVGLFEFGHDAATNQLFYSMPYISGRTISTLIKRGFNTPYFGPAEALWITIGLFDALSYVHTLRDETGHPLSVVHRDVSPENLLVSFDGKLTLIDFGIAISELTSSQTQFRKVKGKAQYLSPEQARGEHALDRRTDIYAAGLILYFLLTGREAYSSDFMTALNQARNPKLAPLNKVADIPNELANIAHSMLQPDPARRPNDARELARHLNAMLQRFYPGYDQWTFSDNVRFILKREHDEERNFLAAMESGTQIINSSKPKRPAPPRADASGAHPTARRAINEQSGSGAIRQNTAVIDTNAPAKPKPTALSESTSPIVGRSSNQHTVPDMPAYNPRGSTTKEMKAAPTKPSKTKPSKTADRSMEDIFEELENLYKKP